MYYFRTLASGGRTDLQGLQALADLEAQAPEGACLQAELTLDMPSWAVGTVASALDASLRLKGTTRCGDGPLAWAAPDGQTLVIRWRKGLVWWAVILGALVALVAVGAVVVLFWRLSEALSLPGWVAFVGVGLTILAPAFLRLMTEYYRARAQFAVAEATLRGHQTTLPFPPGTVGEPAWL